MRLKDTCKRRRNAKRNLCESVLYSVERCLFKMPPHLSKAIHVSNLSQRLRQFARALKQEIYALYLAYQHPETPWYAKIWALGVVAYAISPIDLIPDFVPMLGYLDDVILLPMGIWIALRLIPAPILIECRERSREKTGKPTSPAGRWAAMIIVLMWVIVIGVVIVLLVRAQQGL
jgi:uncharacterized membrane protein YkvA (DUF1232 family)